MPKTHQLLIKRIHTPAIFPVIKLQVDSDMCTCALCFKPRTWIVKLEPKMNRNCHGSLIYVSLEHKAVISSIAIFVAITNNTLYGSKL